MGATPLQTQIRYPRIVTCCPWQAVITILYPLEFPWSEGASDKSACICQAPFRLLVKQSRSAFSHWYFLWSLSPSFPDYGETCSLSRKLQCSIPDLPPGAKCYDSVPLQRCVHLSWYRGWGWFLGALHYYTVK